MDELHALAENKRGAHLSVSLERLERLVARDSAPGLCRIGLSATISPLETMAGFLVGEGRPCVLAEARNQRRAIIEVFSPVRRNPYPPAGQSAGRVLLELGALIRRQRSVLIFTNTRAGAEGLGLRLKTALPKLAGKIEVHHGSLDRNLRLDVEDRLKNGELRAVVCSTSLEMGVDIGAIDLVVMISAPKGISRTLQRIGRSGHAVDATSHGILVATNIVDLVECAVTARLARERRLDPVRVPENSADVLAQHVVGMALEEPGIAAETVWETRAPRVAVPAAGTGGVRPRGRISARRRAFAGAGVRGHVRQGARGRDGALCAATPRVGREYLVNVGTIATEGLVNVTLGRRALGTVDEFFIKGLKVGDVFVLGGRVVRLLEAGWQAAKVEAADGAQPNVPAWSASRLPMTAGLASEVARLRGDIEDRMAADPQDAEHRGILDWLVETWDFSLANAQAVVAQYALQRRHSMIPRDGLTLIELYRETGRQKRARRTIFSTRSRVGRSTTRFRGSSPAGRRGRRAAATPR